MLALNMVHQKVCMAISIRSRLRCKGKNVSVKFKRIKCTLKSLKIRDLASHNGEETLVSCTSVYELCTRNLVLCNQCPFRVFPLLHETCF